MFPNISSLVLLKDLCCFSKLQAAFERRQAVRFRPGSGSTALRSCSPSSVSYDLSGSGTSSVGDLAAVTGDRHSKRREFPLRIKTCLTSAVVYMGQTFKQCHAGHISKSLFFFFFGREMKFVSRSVHRKQQSCDPFCGLRMWKNMKSWCRSCWAFGMAVSRKDGQVYPSTPTVRCFGPKFFSNLPT